MDTTDSDGVAVAEVPFLSGRHATRGSVQAGPADPREEARRVVSIECPGAERSPDL